MLQTEQFYALYSKGYIPRSEQNYSEIELILYLFPDGVTFMEASHLIELGAKIVESKPDYYGWRYHQTYNLESIPINLFTFITNDHPFYRDFAKRYAGSTKEELVKQFYIDLPFYQLFVMDFDYDSGLMNNHYFDWVSKPHDYIQKREGRIKFEGCRTRKK